MGRRTWVKIYTDRWLRGSIRKEPLEVRAVFVDLLALAGDSAYGDNGEIKLAESVGFTDEVISGILNVPLDVWKKVRKALTSGEERRIEITPITQGYSIKIVNWMKYQSEYHRQKTYRGTKKDNPKLQPKLQDKLQGKLQKKLHGERDIEGERERDLEKDRKKKNIVCPEPKKTADSGPPSAPSKTTKNPRISLNFSTHQWENINKKDIAGWTEAYPAVDVPLTLRQIAEYFISNPQKKKSNWRRTITNWMKREQDRGGNKIRAKPGGAVTRQRLEVLQGLTSRIGGSREDIQGTGREVDLQEIKQEAIKALNS